MGATYKELKAVQTKQTATRQAIANEHMDKRKQAAEELMADIIHDVPELPAEPEPRTTPSAPLKKTTTLPQKQKKSALKTQTIEHREKPLSERVVPRAAGRGQQVGHPRAGVDYSGDWLRYSTESYKLRRYVSG